MINSPNFIEVVEFQTMPYENVIGITVNVHGFALCREAISYPVQAHYTIYARNTISNKISPIKASTIMIPQEVVAMWADDDNIIINYVLIHLGFSRKYPVE